MKGDVGNDRSTAWQRYNKDRDNDGRHCETSADKYETVWPVFQEWNGRCDNL